MASPVKIKVTIFIFPHYSSHRTSLYINVCITVNYRLTDKQPTTAQKVKVICRPVFANCLYPLLVRIPCNFTLQELARCRGGDRLLLDNLHLFSRGGWQCPWHRMVRAQSVFCAIIVRLWGGDSLIKDSGARGGRTLVKELCFYLNTLTLTRYPKSLSFHSGPCVLFSTQDQQELPNRPNVGHPLFKWTKLTRFLGNKPMYCFPFLPHTQKTNALIMGYFKLLLPVCIRSN